MQRNVRFGLILSSLERQAVERLAEMEGGLSKAAIVRRLIREAAKQRGLWTAEKQRTREEDNHER